MSSILQTGQYVHAVEAHRPIGIALELAAQEYAQAWKALGGKTSIIEAAQEFARRNLHDLSETTVPEAVKVMLEAKAGDGASKPHALPQPCPARNGPVPGDRSVRRAAERGD